MGSSRKELINPSFGTSLAIVVFLFALLTIQVIQLGSPDIICCLSSFRHYRPNGSDEVEKKKLVHGCKIEHHVDDGIGMLFRPCIGPSPLMYYGKMFHLPCSCLAPICSSIRPRGVYWGQPLAWLSWGSAWALGFPLRWQPAPLSPAPL